MLDSRVKELLGYLIDTIGQTMSAIANTPSIINDKQLPILLDLWGNVFQATGAVLVADSIERFSFKKLGNQLESAGNLVSVISVLVTVNDGVKVDLDKKGNIIETLGVIVSLPDELEDGFTLELFFDLYGHLLQVMKVIDVDEQFIHMISEWTQVLASILSLLSALKEYSTNKLSPSSSV